MREGHEIGRYMPKEIEPWKGSATIRHRMRDYQRSWFDELLMTGWANGEMPCHVPNNENDLWREAGAHSKEFFRAHSAVVIGEFRVCGQGLWICNDKSLELYLQKLANYLAKRSDKVSERYKVDKGRYLSFLTRCSCISERKKQELGIVVVLDSFDPDDYLPELKAIGFRGSTSTLVERAYMQEVEHRVEESQRPRAEIATDILTRCKRIYELTDSGSYAPKLYELLSGEPRSYQEAEHLWERKGNAKSSEISAGLSSAELRADRSAGAIKSAFDKYREPAGAVDGGRA